MKEIYYFSHEINARNDRKLQNLNMVMGMEGIGIYWCLIEIMYSENGYINFPECEKIAFELRIEIKKLKKVIFSFNLFQKNKKCFFSNSILERMKKLEEKSKKARQSALARWNANALKKNANALRTHEERNTKKIKRNAIKQNKVKESKINKQTAGSKLRISVDKNNLPISHKDNLLFLKKEFEEKIGINFTYNIYNKYFGKYEPERIQHILIDMISRKNKGILILNPIGYIREVLKK